MHSLYLVDDHIVWVVLVCQPLHDVSVLVLQAGSACICTALSPRLQDLAAEVHTGDASVTADHSSNATGAGSRHTVEPQLATLRL